MYKSFKSQPYSRPTAVLIPHSSLSSSEDRCLAVSLSPLHLTGPSPTCSTVIPPCYLVKMISKSFLALLILALTSSVNAAAIPPARQFLLEHVVREGLLLTSDLN